MAFLFCFLSFNPSGNARYVTEFNGDFRWEGKHVSVSSQLFECSCFHIEYFESFFLNHKFLTDSKYKKKIIMFMCASKRSSKSSYS